MSPRGTDRRDAAVSLRVGQPMGYRSPEQWACVGDTDRANAVLQRAHRDDAQAAAAVAKLAGLGNSADPNDTVFFLSRALHGIASRMEMAGIVPATEAETAEREAKRAERKRRMAGLGMPHAG